MAAPIKLGLFTDSYPDLGGYGGIATYTRALAVALTQLGHEVHVLTSGRREQSGAYDGVHVHCMPLGAALVRSPDLDRQRSQPDLVHRVARWGAPGARGAWRVSRHARRLADQLQLTVFEFPNYGGHGAFYTLGRRPRARLVVHLYTSTREVVELEERPLSREERFRSRLERWTCRAAHTLVSSSRAHRDTMARELDLPAARISVVPLGLPDIDQPAARTVRPPGRPLTAVFLGRLERRKGVTTLLAAVPTLVAAIPELQLVLIGEDLPHAPGGRLHRDYWQQEFPDALQPHVTFTGRLPDADVQSWLSHAALFVAPSLYESFGLIFVEAMRWSLPVVGTRVGGIPEVVEDGSCGLLVPPADAEALAAAMLHILRHEAVRARMAAAARATFEKRLTQAVMAQNALALYAAVAV